MKTFDVTAKNFRQLPRGNDEENVFDSILLIPTGELHDSGWGAFAIVGCKRDEAVCFWSEGSDVIHLDGIGGYGRDWNVGLASGKVPVKGWSLDVTPKGIIRIFAGEKYKLILPDMPLSSFDLYAEKGEGNGI